MAVSDFRPSGEALAFITQSVLESCQRINLRAKRNGGAIPGEIQEVFDFLNALRDSGSGVSEGQAVSRIARSGDVGQVGHMAPLLNTYDETAALLGVSLSTVKRLVRDGVLEPVSVVGARRLRRSDLESYVQNLTTTERQAG